MLNILCITATSPANLIDIADINSCHGTITLKVNGEQPIKKGEYNIVGCKEVDNNKWNCPCDNFSTIVMEAGENTTNVYDVIAEYYILPKLDSNNTNVTPTKVDIENEQRRRTYEFNNIEVKPKDIVEEPFIMPIFSDGWIIGIVVGGVFCGIILLIVGVIIWLMKGEDKESPKSKKRQEFKVDNTLSDEEILNQLRNNIN